MELTLVWNNESRLSDLALALLEDDNGEDDGDTHAEYLDAQHHSAEQVVVVRHARGVPAADIASLGARHAPAQEMLHHTHIPGNAEASKFGTHLPQWHASLTQNCC
jgi:hypothetical protein